MSVFKTQSLLRLILDTDYNDLAGASIKRILVTKPVSGAKTYYDATVSGTTLYYDLQNNDIDETGIWQFQAYIESGGLKGFGDIVQKRFEKTLL